MMNAQGFLPHRRPLPWIIALGMLVFSPAVAAQSLIQASNANVRTSAALSTPGHTGETMRIRVQTRNGPLALVLHAHTQIIASAANALPQLGLAALRVYRGTVEGQPESWVRMSQIDGAWLGAVHSADRLWLFDPAKFHPGLAARFGVGRSATLVFKLSDIVGLTAFDEGSVLPPRSVGSGGLAAPFASSASLLLEKTTGASLHLGVSLVLDTEFQDQYGASAVAVATAILNVADGFYNAQANTDLYLRHMRLLASNGSMTSTEAGALLDAFTAYVDSSALPLSGVAHLLSGKDFDGNTAGLAWVGALCNNPYGSGIDQATYSAAASGAFLAHEIGHNYGADHDGVGNACPSSGYILASLINVDIPANEFSTCSLDYFADYLANNSHACLLVAPDLIFANDFE